MIESIYIRNYGIIRETEIFPSRGFNVITGETGAGKSMLVSAISLLMGERSSGVHLPDPEQKAILEMTLDINPEELNVFFEDNDIDKHLPLIIRREFNAQGRSRTFINDSPVSLQTLKSLLLDYVDLSEQNENMSLQLDTFAYELLDAFSGNQALLEQYRKLFKAKKRMERELMEKQELIQKIKSEQDYIQFQYDELHALSYKANEKADLEEELELLSHAEEVKQSLYSAFQVMDAEHGLNSMMEDVLIKMRTANQHLSAAQELSTRLQEIHYELKDIAAELERHFEQTEDDPQRMQEVEERLDLIYKLVQKHHLADAEDLLELTQNFQLQLDSVDELEHEVQALMADLKKLDNNFKEAALELTQARKKNLKSLSKEIESRLAFLSMPEAHFSIDMQKSNDCSIWGFDDLTLLFSANKGIPAAPLSKVASGGERSRLMLAIKSLLGSRKKLDTLIFDEIDSGISGEAAARVGEVMRELAHSAQLLVISHLPQIAACADRHFVVEKNQEGVQAQTHLMQVEGEERVQIIATMISGEKESGSARKAAKEMLG